MTKRLQTIGSNSPLTKHSRQYQYDDPSMVSCNGLQSTDTNSLIDAMLFHITAQQSEMAAIAQKQQEREYQHMQMKLEEKQKDRELAERLAQIKIEERLKDRLSKERIAQMKIDNFLNHRQVIVHEKQNDTTSVSYIERRPSETRQSTSWISIIFTFLSLFIAVFASTIAFVAIKNGDINHLLNFQF